jgi:hypothetical protein
MEWSMNAEPKDVVDRDFLALRLEPFLLKRLPRSRKSFALRRLDPAFTPNRLDLAAKLHFLKHSANPDLYPARLYDAHIHAFSLGDMTEPGNEQKAGADGFRADFLALRERMRKHGFDADVSLMPLAADGTIINGGHRVACALDLGVELVGVETDLEPVDYDWRYFRDRGMAGDDLEAMVLAYLTYDPHAALAFLWPAAPTRTADAERLLGRPVFRKGLNLSEKAGHNLLSQVYAGEDWLGSPSDGYAGIANKLAPCFSSSRPLRLLALSLPSVLDRVALKDQIRLILGHDKHTIHITDTQQEAVDLGRLLLSRQGLHFLEHASPTRFPQVAARVAEFRRQIILQGGDAEDTALDTGMVVGAYGLREPGDVDYRSSARIELPEPFERRLDPGMHFHFWGQRFVSLPLVAEMKRRRLAGRDREDLLLIEDLELRSRRDNADERRAIRLRLLKARTRRTLIHLLARLGLRDIVRRAYRWAVPRS